MARKMGTQKEWSGPVALGTGGVGWGAQIGGSKTNGVIVLNSWSAIKAFAGQAQVKLGGDLSVAAGPLGRTAAADVRVGKGVAACYSYSHSSGLFAGIALEGALLITLDKDNEKFYGNKVSPQDILYGQVKPSYISSDLQYIYDTLNQYNFEGQWDDITPTDVSTVPQSVSAPTGGYGNFGQSTPTGAYGNFGQGQPEQPSTTPIVESPFVSPVPGTARGPEQFQSPGDTSGISDATTAPGYLSPRSGLSQNYGTDEGTSEPPGYLSPRSGVSPFGQSGPSATPSHRARANFDFESPEPGDLNFKAGDVMQITKQEGEWWEAEKDGVNGIIPGNYVSMM